MFKYFISQVLFLILLFILSNCTKENDKIGNNLIPPGDSLAVKFDNSTPISASTVESQISTKNLSENCLGVITDSLFGITKTGILASFTPTNYYETPSTFNDYVGNKHVVDSVEFFLIVSDTVFLNDNYSNIEIYGMTQALSTSEDFYSTTDPSSYYDNSTVLGTFSQRINQITTNVDTLKFTIANSVGEKLLNPSISDSAYKSAADFINYYKGFYIKVNDAINEDFYMLVDLYSDDTYLKVYFTKDDTISSDIFFTFNTLNEYYTSFNNVTHDYTNTYAAEYLANTTLQKQHNLIYQFGGLETHLAFPAFSQWIDSMPLAINKANLVLPLDADFFGSTKTDYLPLLIIRQETGVNTYTDLLDETLYSSNTIGGYFNSEKNAYIFNIRNHLQYILDGESSQTNASLVIRPYFYDFGSGTIIENDSINGRIELDIWYTDLRDK